MTRILRGNGLLTVAKRRGGSGRAVWELDEIVFLFDKCVARSDCVCMYIRKIARERESVKVFCPSVGTRPSRCFVHQ